MNNQVTLYAISERSPRITELEAEERPLTYKLFRTTEYSGYRTILYKSNMTDTHYGITVVATTKAEAIDTFLDLARDKIDGYNEEVQKLEELVRQVEGEKSP